MDDDPVYCIIEFLSAPIDICSESQNEQYVFDTNADWQPRARTPEFQHKQDPEHAEEGRFTYERVPSDLRRPRTPEIPRGPALAMKINKASMKDPYRGHLFGSDRDACDVLLDVDNRRGVSRRHFYLRLNAEAERPDELWIVNSASLSELHLDNQTLIPCDRHSLVPGIAYCVQAGPHISFLITFLGHHLNEKMWTELQEARSPPLWSHESPETDSNIKTGAMDMEATTFDAQHPFNTSSVAAHHAP
ncbi:hypothetical protein LTR97_008983 [Elasticomyces elasticus]|uniref:FHA domain-containing protein n=1 Tax=Elasticomyces elasticus TaxID=574655 RepID=A0AAN7WC70_9PEZI|nr:hypothetical protein LTR97_008983 [Elasticomyces elasticus]